MVRAYSAARLGDALVIAMEYVEGDDLARLVAAGGPLPVPHACYYVGKKTVVKILDFGLAKATSEGKVDGGLTGEGG